MCIFEFGVAKDKLLNRAEAYPPIPRRSLGNHQLISEAGQPPRPPPPPSPSFLCPIRRLPLHHCARPRPFRSRRRPALSTWRIAQSPLSTARPNQSHEQTLGPIDLLRAFPTPVILFLLPLLLLFLDERALSSCILAPLSFSGIFFLSTGALDGVSPIYCAAQLYRVPTSNPQSHTSHIRTHAHPGLGPLGPNDGSAAVRERCARLSDFPFRFVLQTSLAPFPGLDPPRFSPGADLLDK